MVSDYYYIDDNSLKSVLDEESVLEWTEHIAYRPPTSFSYDTSTSERVSELHRYIKTLWLEIRKSPQALIPLPEEVKKSWENPVVRAQRSKREGV
jgi:hypothetical protein